jgi:hypothetical protein
MPPGNPLGLNSDLTDLWDSPGEGENVEGCVARAFYEAYRATLDINPNPDFLAAITNTTPNLNWAGHDLTTARAFNDSNHTAAFEAADPLLDDFFIEFIGPNGFGLTNPNGLAQFSAPSGQVTGVTVSRGVMEPAALTRTSQLDLSQDSLDPVVNANQTAEIFAGLFYQCWLPEDKTAKAVYLGMLNYAHDWAHVHGNDNFYNIIRRIFWDNNMLLPLLQQRTVLAPMTIVYRLEDELENPISGSFTANVIQLVVPATDLVVPAHGNIIGPRPPGVNDTTITTNGVIDVQALNLHHLTRTVVIDINVRSLIPNAIAANHDVWVRGVFHH